MRVGVTLPQFTDRADEALAAARRAEQLGLDGVFCFDHLWPMGQPDRPALSSAPLLGALAASTTRIALGTLVARIGLLADEELLAVLTGLATMSGGRFIAGIGTGDRHSRGENEAFGVPFDPAAERRERVAAVAAAARARDIPVWIGGASADTVALARGVGAAVNLWATEVPRVADVTASGAEATWGGPIDEAQLAVRLGALADAGASWVVCAWPSSLEAVAAAAADLRDPR